MQVFLALSGHPKANVRQVIVSRTTVIGRSGDCGLQIASASVSRKHCELRITDDAVSVVDLGSSNGTFIGPDRLPAGEERSLPTGASLNVGGVRFLVTYDAPAVRHTVEVDQTSVAAAAATAPVTSAAAPISEDAPILEDDVFVLDEPIEAPPATTSPPPVVAGSVADAKEDEFVLDDEPDLAAMFADEPVPTRTPAVEPEPEPEADAAGDEPILASDEDDAFAFLTEDDPAPVETRREDSRLGA